MTDEDIYTEVDHYLDGLFATDPVLDAVLERSDAAGLPAIQVSAGHGRLLRVLALVSRATRILEIGTLGGYSTIWLARALPADGMLLSLESEATHAEVARRNVATAGLADRVEIRVGRAVDSLSDIEREGAEPFDMVFIDADKPAYAEYFSAVLRLSAPGTLIVADNVVRGGDVVNATTGDEAVVGIRRFNAALANEARVAGAFIQQVGVKGHDGMALAVVR